MRKARGLTQESLARQAGVASQTISRWERDKDRPRIDEALRTARALGVSLSYFVGETDDLVQQFGGPEELRAGVEAVIALWRKSGGGARWRTIMQMLKALGAEAND